MVAQNSFREDLYYRINVFSLTLPPLRERKESIPYLISLFVAQNCENLNKEMLEFSNEAKFALISYDYPGNIRELRNIIEHAAVVNDGGTILFEDLPEYLQKYIEEKYLNHKRLAIEYNNAQSAAAQKPEETNSEDVFCIDTLLSIDEAETAYIKFVLEKCKNNYSQAAKILGISRSTIWRKLNNERS
jgi:two-component system nitrogen regulation response regulator GlnG